MENIKLTIGDMEEKMIYIGCGCIDVLSQCLIDLGYLSDYPENLVVGDKKQQRELQKVYYEKTLKPLEIKEIISYISNELENTNQYEMFTKVFSGYINYSKHCNKNEREER